MWCSNSTLGNICRQLSARSTNGPPLVIPLLAALMAVSILAGLLVLASKSFGRVSDLPEYYCAARLVIAGSGAQVYDLAALGRAENTTFPSLAGRCIGLMVPPLAIPVLMPLGFCPPSWAPTLWKIINVSALLASLCLLKALGELDTKTFLWFLAWFALSGPLFESLRIDQLAPLLLLALCAALWALKHNHPIVAAFALSVFWLKPQQIWPFALVLLACKRFKVISIATIISILLGLVSWYLLGYKGITNYAMVLSPVAEPFMQSNLGPTIRGQLLRIFPQQSQAVMVFSLLALIAISLLIFFTARRFASGKNAIEIGTLLAMPLGLLASLHCHDYDLILLAPAIVFLLKYASKLTSNRWLLLAFAILVIPFMLSFYEDIHYSYLLIKGGLINPYFGILLVFALGVLVLIIANKTALNS